MTTKTLTINGKEIAKYQIEGTNLFLKTRHVYPKLSPEESENVTTKIIEYTEGVIIGRISYLNIP